MFPGLMLPPPSVVELEANLREVSSLTITEKAFTCLMFKLHEGPFPALVCRPPYDGQIIAQHKMQTMECVLYNTAKCGLLFDL